MPALRCLAFLFLLAAPAAVLADAPGAPYPVIWNRQFGTPTWDRAFGVAADGLGGVYLAGQTDGNLGAGNSGMYDAFLKKVHTLDAGDNWSALFGDSGDDFGTGVSADKLGNVFLTGYTPGKANEPGGPVYQGILAKYDSNGAAQWSVFIGPNKTYSYGVSADGLGNAYVAGYTTGSVQSGVSNAGGYDAFVSKYDTAGNSAWTRQFGTSGQDQAYGVSADGASSVYVTGSTLGALNGQTSSGGSDAFVTKYDDAGASLWTRQFGTLKSDSARAIAATSAGSVLVAGSTAGTLPGQTSQGGDDAFIAKYNSGGDLQWTKQFGTTLGDYASAVTTDSRGNVYVAGYTQGALGAPNLGGYDIFLSKYAADGSFEWTQQYGTSRYEYATGIATDGLGNFFVSASTVNPVGPDATNYDALVIRFSLPLLHGDYNRDGLFDGADIIAMFAAFADLNSYQAAAGLTTQDVAAIGDFTDDGFVNSADLQGLISALLNMNAQQNNVIPEPASIILMAGAGLGLALMVQRAQRRGIII